MDLTKSDRVAGTSPSSSPSTPRLSPNTHNTKPTSSPSSRESSTSNRKRSRSLSDHEELKFTEDEDDEVFEKNPLLQVKIEEKPEPTQSAFNPYAKEQKRRSGGVPAPLLLPPTSIPSNFSSPFPSPFSPLLNFSPHQIPILDPASPFLPQASPPPLPPLPLPPPLRPAERPGLRGAPALPQPPPLHGAEAGAEGRGGAGQLQPAGRLPGLRPHPALAVPAGAAHRRRLPAGHRVDRRRLGVQAERPRRGGRAVGRQEEQA